MYSVKTKLCAVVKKEHKIKTKYRLPTYPKPKCSDEKGSTMAKDLIENLFEMKLLLPLNLQMFAEGGEGDDDLDGGEGGEGGNDNPSNSQVDFAELLKDPTFKAQYEAQLQKNLKQRMKKYDGVDIEEYKQLKQLQKEIEEKDLTELQKAQKRLADLEAANQEFAVKEKRIAVKEYAIDNGMNPKLVARLIDIDSIKKGEQGWEGLEEAIESLVEEFPDLFNRDNDGEGEGSNGRKSTSTYTAPRQKGNNPTKKNPYDSGKSRAMARHKKTE